MGETGKRVLLGGILMAAALLALWLARGRLLKPAPLPSAPVPSLTAPAVIPPPAASVAPAPVVSAQPTSGAAWEDFRNKYGKGLKAEHLKDGRLVSVRGAPGAAEVVPGFSPQDPEKAIQRAKEIVEDARELLGLQASLPVEVSTTKTNAASAQVFFQELAAGLLLAPYGKLVVDLGPRGELVGLESDYLPDVRVTRQPGIGVEEARERALQALPENLRSSKVEGGSLLIWVPGDRQGDGTEGRHAFEFHAAGRQIIVDAYDGKILFVRDRRDH